MHKTSFFVTGSFAIALGAVVCFSGTAVSNAAEIDAMKLYMTHCKTCHGEDGHPTELGEGLGARDFSNKDWQAQTADERIIEQITKGTPEKMMPFNEKLTPEEIKALVPVVRSFGKK